MNLWSLSSLILHVRTNLNSGNLSAIYLRYVSPPCTLESVHNFCQLCIIRKINILKFAIHLHYSSIDIMFLISCAFPFPKSVCIFHIFQIARLCMQIGILSFIEYKILRCNHNNIMISFLYYSGMSTLLHS